MKLKPINYIGFALIAFGLLLNPFVVDNLLLPNKPLLKSHSEIIWIFDSFCLCVGIILSLIPRIDPGWLVSVFVIYIFLFGFEMLIRAKPSLVGVGFANQVLTKYHTRHDGIYFFDSDLRMNFMKPNFEVDMFFNGYQWKHKSDKFGFRNSSDKDKADILLIGDSFIYGHGVEQENTLAHYLEDVSLKSVFNMGRQGDYAYPELYLLEEFGIHRQPKFVFYFFFQNDLADLKYYNRDSISAFLERPIEQINFPELPSFDKYTDQQNKRLGQEGIYFLRYIDYLWKRRGGSVKTGKSFTDVSTPAEGFFGGKRNERKMFYLDYTTKAAERMKYICDRNGATFVMVPIVHGMYFDLLDMLEEFANEKNIPFISLREFMQQEEHFLPRDFHFNAKGNEQLANILNNWLKDWKPNNNMLQAASDSLETISEE